jgi:hypothetical protein
LRRSLQRWHEPGVEVVPEVSAAGDRFFTVRQASAEMIIVAGSIGLLDRRPEV